MPEIRQIILMEEPNFEDWLIKTFASTGTTSYNHANDVYPETLGLAIPWELLDGDFVNSVTALGGDDDFRVLIEKPTLFSSILLPELTLRNAHLCFRDGKIVITRPSVIDAASATHTLTTSHKAAATPDDASRDRTRSQRSRSSIVNVLKVEYDRDFEGNYHRVTEVTNEQSRSDYGQSQPITIQARNSLRLKPGHAEESARQLIASLSGDMLSFHSEPSPLVSRSINPAAWFVTPGDTVSLSDDSVRSSTTGLRGVTVATGWITRIVQDWGTGIG